MTTAISAGASPSQLASSSTSRSCSGKTASAWPTASERSSSGGAAPASGRDAQLLAHAIGEPLAAQRAAALVGEDPPRHAVEPQARLGLVGHVADPPPRDAERLRDDIGGVFAVIDAP